MPFSLLTHLDCPVCGLEYSADEIHGLCSCGSPLLARYDLAAVGAALRPQDLADRAPTMWRYHELLPVRDPTHVTTLGEGMTPMTPAPALGADLDVPGLLVKDESPLPTGTFKARGAAAGVSRARELGVRTVALPTNGNAGAAWAAYAARAGLRCLVVMPQDAPSITAKECVALGADVVLVRGLIGDAGAIVAAAVAGAGPEVLDAATLKEPYRVEGKKTMGLEIAEQLGWRLPDVVVYPAGGGVGLIGIHKAFVELLELGWVSGELPRFVVVQSSGCAPIVEAFDAGRREIEAWPDAHTIAFGITVPRPLGGGLVLDALGATGGIALAVDDDELLAEQASCARLEGLFVCPEGAATLAAVRRLRGSGWIAREDSVVAVNTGTGLIYPDTVSSTHLPLVDIGAEVALPAIDRR
jgi:threonine synthase